MIDKAGRPTRSRVTAHDEAQVYDGLQRRGFTQIQILPPTMEESETTKKTPVSPSMPTEKAETTRTPIVEPAADASVAHGKKSSWRNRIEVLQHIRESWIRKPRARYAGYAALCVAIAIGILILLSPLLSRRADWIVSGITEMGWIKNDKWAFPGSVLYSYQIDRQSDMAMIAEIDADDPLFVLVCVKDMYMNGTTRFMQVTGGEKRINGLWDSLVTDERSSAVAACRTALRDLADVYAGNHEPLGRLQAGEQIFGDLMREHGNTLMASMVNGGTRPDEERRRNWVLCMSVAYFLQKHPFVSQAFSWARQSKRNLMLASEQAERDIGDRVLDRASRQYLMNEFTKKELDEAVKAAEALTRALQDLSLPADLWSAYCGPHPKSVASYSPIGTAVYSVEEGLLCTFPDIKLD
jgi:hypothetical protein